jgi:hypothetical protein
LFPCGTCIIEPPILRYDPSLIIPEVCAGIKMGLSIEAGGTAPYKVSLDAINGTYTQVQ